MDGTIMKVLGLSGSMRKDGNTALLIKEILKHCRHSEIQTEFISLAGKKIQPCLGCEKCKEKKWCVNERDDWDKIIEKVIGSDVLVVGSPTYYYDINGQLKNFIDRTYSLYHDRKLAGKKGVAVAVHAQKGANRTIQTLEGFLGAHEFSSLGYIIGSGYDKGDVQNDAEAMEKAKKIGQKIIRLIEKKS